MTIKIGTMAVVFGLQEDVEFNGLVITIKDIYYCHDPWDEGWWVLSDHNGNSFLPENLRPLDDYDGYETTSWEDCIWQPKELVRVEV